MKTQLLKDFTLLIFALAISINFAQAQRGSGHGQSGSGPAGGAIKLQVLDNNDGEPIEYANIVVFSVKDSSMVSGGITDTSGKTMIKPLPFGHYYLTIDFIGYNKHFQNSIKLTPRKPVYDAGTIKLNPATELLDDVTIEADRKHIEYKIDKKIVNVSQDISAQGGSAVDVLENTPSIQTDIEGNVQLRGSSSFTVLIDGKPTPLEGSEALQQIPASAIENIEIITNPSAKYDPDGVAGIINIVMKHQENDGVNGNVNLSYDSFDAINGDFLINIRQGKFNFFIGADYSDRQNQGTNENIIARFLGDSTFVTDIAGDGTWAHGGYSGRLGFDYYMTDKDVFTVSGKYGKWQMDRNTDRNYMLYYSGNTEPEFGTDILSPATYYQNNTFFNIDNTYYSGDINYQHKFNTEGHNLQAYYFFSGSDKSESSGFKRYDTDSVFNQDSENFNEAEQSSETGNNIRMRAKLDYTNPFSEHGKIEAGYQFRNRIGPSDYEYEIWNGTEYIDDSTQFNYIDFNRQIHAAYATFTNRIWKFDYMLGLRGEYTKRNFESITLGENWTYEKLDVFPTAHISRKLKYDIQLQASYSSRIRRPRGWFLDPFLSKTDEFTYRQGNPNLKPAYINSYEFNVQKRFGKHFIALESFYKQTTDLFERVTTVDPDNPEIIIHSFENVGSDESYGMEIMGNINFANWWNLNLTADLYQYTIDADIENSSTGENSTLTYSTRINNTFKIKKTDTRIQLSGRYNGPSITSQGERGAFFMINSAVRQEFFKRQFSVMLSVNDIFGTMQYERESYTQSFYSYSNFDRISPTFRVTLSYKFNDFERRKDNNDTIEAEGGDGMM